MIAVYTTVPELHEQASELADRLGLPLLDAPDLKLDDPYPMLLQLSEQGVALCATGKKRPGPVYVNFISGASAHRRQFGGGKGQLIAKACGLSGSARPRIADLTAGLGGDAFVLASLGCEVDMVERVPVVFELLNDGIQRGRDQGSDEEKMILSRMHLTHLDAVSWCRQNTGVADVIYLDPMFPHSGKSAQVKKEMLAFRSLVGADQDASDVLAAALEAKPRRVVVKRPRKAPAIDGVKPTYSLEGKSGRFDIYALRKLD